MAQRLQVEGACCRVDGLDPLPAQIRGEKAQVFIDREARLDAVEVPDIVAALIQIARRAVQPRFARVRAR